MPGQGPGGLHEIETSRISRQSAHEGGKVVSPTHRPPLPPPQEYIPGTHFCFVNVVYFPILIGCLILRVTSVMAAFRRHKF